MTPRSARPEVMDLTAMRELANLQTHLAITRHKTSFRRRRALERWVITAVTSGSAAVLTYYWAYHGTATAGYSGAIAWVLAIWSGSDAALTTRHVWKDRTAEKLRTSMDNPAGELRIARVTAAEAAAPDHARTSES